MNVDQLQLVASRELGERLRRQRLQALPVDREKARQRSLITALERELRLHFFQQVQFPQPAAKRLRPLKLRLIFFKEAQHVLQILRSLAVIVEQALTAPFLVAPDEELTTLEAADIAAVPTEADREARQTGRPTAEVADDGDGPTGGGDRSA